MAPRTVHGLVLYSGECRRRCGAELFSAESGAPARSWSKTATFLGVSTAEGIFAVTSREVDLAIINPAAVLSVAMRGKGIFKEPMPVRAIAVIPSGDQFVFAVRPETGLLFLEDIACPATRSRRPLAATHCRGCSRLGRREQLPARCLRAGPRGSPLVRLFATGRRALGRSRYVA
jgi:hypothetical protein